MFKHVILSSSLLALVGVVGCSSYSPGKKEFRASKVIERVGGKDETPTWASAEEPLVEESGKVVFINTVTMSGDARPETCVKAAEETGRAQMLRHIKDAMTTGGQVSELSSTGDPGVESLTAFLSQGKLSGASISARYWEKREESDASGDRVLKLRCSAKVAIAKGILDKQLQAAINGGEGNAEIRSKLLSAQKTFIDNIGKSEASAERETAGEN